MADLWTSEHARQRHPVLAFFARRPITVSVILLAVAVLGLISMRLMPMELFPSGLERTSMSVEVPFNRTGAVASPDVVEREVTLIVEGELSTIPGINELSATSRGTSADFRITFDTGRDMDQAYAEVWAAVERARLRLPSTIGQISVRRWRGDSNAWPVASVNFAWEDGTPDPYLTLERVIAPRLESVEGVASVTFDGTHRKYIAVDLDPEKIGAYGIDLSNLLQRLRADNFRAPAGKVTVSEFRVPSSEFSENDSERGTQNAELGTQNSELNRRDVYLVADSRFRSVQEIEELPVRPGLQLSDITRHGVAGGKAHRGVYETHSVGTYVRVDRKWGASARIHKTADANTVEVGERIEAELEQMRSMPELVGFDMRVPRNQGRSIQESIGTLRETLMIGGLLAFCVMLIFLKSLRLSLIIALSIPLAMTMALAVMYFMGETINLLALMGFTLAAGMLLDNSIVVAENVFRRHSLGEKPYAAAVRGAGEVGLALVLATSTTIIVFVTVVFVMDEPMISFFMGKIGLPVCLSILFSILLALGVIPLTMNRTGMLQRKKPSAFRRWFVRRRKRLTGLWRGEDLRRVRGRVPLFARRAILLPAIAAWELAALVAGRNERGLPSTPIMNALTRGYERLVTRLIAPRYVVAGLAVVLTFAAVNWLWGAQVQTDENQGNRDTIWMRARFDDGTDIMVTRNALQVTGIAADSAAERAGVRLGDFILRYNSRPVDSLDALRRLEQSAPRGALVPLEVARGTQTGELEIAAGPSGIDGYMQDTQPLRDRVWISFVEQVENILLGREDAAVKREQAVNEHGMSEDRARAMYGRTEAEAREYFGIESLNISFRESSANFMIFLDTERVDQAQEFYRRMVQAIPERAGVRMRGEFAGGGSANSEVSVRIMGPETERLVKLAEEVELRLAAIEGLEGLRLDADESMDEVTLAVDRQRAAAYGIEPGMISQVLGFQLGGTSLRDYQHGENLLPLRVRFAAPEDAAGNPRNPDLQDVAESRVVTEAGAAVPSKAFTETTGLARAGLGEIRRRNRQTSMRVVGTTSSEDLMRIQGQVRQAMEGVTFPPGYSQELGGRFEGFGQRNQDMFKGMIWAALLVFLVMCFLFESVLKPMAILSASLPGAILGGLLALYVTATPMDNIAMLGMLVLVGVVVNNGIVLVDLINRLRAEGMNRADAVRTAARQRFRPILLTSLTTAFGLVPMAIGDAQFVGTPYFPLGRMVLGGILVSMLYTLLLVPLLYTILDDIGEAVKGWAAIVFGDRAKGGGQAKAPVPAKHR